MSEDNLHSHYHLKPSCSEDERIKKIEKISEKNGKLKNIIE